MIEVLIGVIYLAIEAICMAGRIVGELLGLMLEIVVRICKIIWCIIKSIYKIVVANSKKRGQGTKAAKNHHDDNGDIG